MTLQFISQRYHKKFFSTLRATVALSVALLGFIPSAHAGCGCDKPAPAQAAVIPHAAYPGMQVTLFDLKELLRLLLR